MKTTVFRNPEKVTLAEVTEHFKKSLNEEYTDVFSKSEIEQLVDAVAKNPTDKYIITEKQDVISAQGDILFWSDATDFYKEVVPTVTELQSTDRLVLQDGDSMTGDHRLIPLKGSKYTLQKGKFVPPVLKGKNSWGDRYYDCLLLTIDKPFVVFHREHGNIAQEAGSYLICTSLDSASLEKMLD